MSKEVRVTDFQISVRSAGEVGDDEKVINEALFATFEPLRLWLKARVIKAPFGKLAVTMTDEKVAGPWHGRVAIAIGICDVTEALPAAVIRENAGDHRWVLAVVSHALERVAKETGWRSEELEQCVAGLSGREWPLVHYFERLARTSSKLRMKCEPWFSAQPGRTQIGVRLSSVAGMRDEVVLTKGGPLYLEDDFPVAKSAIREDTFLLLDKLGEVLASVPLLGERA